MSINYNNILSGQKEDRVEDVNLEIMRRMDDISLFNFCRTNHYYEELAERVVWLERINTVPGLSLLLPYRDRYKTLKSFYFNVRNDAQYVTNRTFPNMKFTHDVNYALMSIKEGATYVTTGKRKIITDEELERSAAILNYPRIMIYFDNMLDGDGTLEDTIYSTRRGDPKYFNPDILSYPVLQKRNVYIAIEETNDSQQDNTPIGKYSCVKNDTNSLRQIHKAKKDINLFFKLFDYETTADFPKRLEWTEYGFFLIGEHTGLFLIDFEALGLTGGYQLLITTDNQAFLKDGGPAGLSLEKDPKIISEQLRQKIKDYYVGETKDVNSTTITDSNKVLTLLRTFYFQRTTLYSWRTQ